MKPYYQSALGKLYNCDCLEFMRDTEPATFDITITSPPYNIGNSVRGSMYQDYDDNKASTEYLNFITSVIENLLLVNKFYTFFNFQLLKDNKVTYLELLGKFKCNIKDIIIWHKKQFQPSIQKQRLSSAFEFILVFAGAKRSESQVFEKAYFNNRTSTGVRSNVIYGNNAAGEQKWANNKATFPIYLPGKILLDFTEKNDVVFDPFMGSGTTAVACEKNGRRWVGCEMSEKYCELSSQRIDSESQQGKFDF